MTDDQRNNLPEEDTASQEESTAQADAAPQEESAVQTDAAPQEENAVQTDAASQEESAAQADAAPQEGSAAQADAIPQEGSQAPEGMPSQPVEAPIPDPQEPAYPWQTPAGGQAPTGGQAPQWGGQPQWGNPPPWAGQPQWGHQQNPWQYPQPPQNPWPQYGWQPVPPKPPKRKMSLGLKVFLWIASALAAGAFLGFTVFTVSWAVMGPQVQTLVEETLPEESLPEETPGEEAQTEEPQLDLPEVDVTPNEEGITIVQKPDGNAMDAQEVYNRVVQSTVAITASRTGETTDSSGTGIIATSDGYIITNAHVVLNTKSVLVTVTTYDGQQYDAVVVGMDRTTDLAVIKTNDYGFTPAEFGDAGELSIGEWVLAIGNPGGERFTSSLTRGIVSGLDRAVERYSENGMTFIQTDAAINPGNSGGPLVNMYGQVVGINSSKIITEGYEGMGFAIPVSKAKDIIDQLLSGGYVEGRVRLGVTGTDLDSMTASLYGVPQGFMIVSIDEDSAFAGTDAQVNDIIVAIDGETVEELQDISNLLLRYSPGDQVTVTLYRMPENGLGEGEEIDVTITLLEDKGETQR